MICFSYDMIVDGYSINYQGWFFLLFIVFIMSIVYRTNRKKKNKHLSSIKYGCIIFSIVVLAQSLIHFKNSYDNYNIKVIEYKKNNVSKYNGDVTGFRNLGRRVESVEISGEWFSYDTSGSLYATPYAYNKYLREGNEVSIWYVEGDKKSIVKMDIYCN